MQLILKKNSLLEAVTEQVLCPSFVETLDVTGSDWMQDAPNSDWSRAAQEQAVAQKKPFASISSLCSWCA
jgi:hypothetical protein